MFLGKRSLAALVDSGAITNSKNEIIVDVASIGLRLGGQVTTYALHPKNPVEPPFEAQTQTVDIGDEGFVLPPMGAVLACTQERVSMPRGSVGFIQTKGSLARGFLTVHMCDGQIDPGYEGAITLEIVNFSAFYYRLMPGMEIAQLYIAKLDEEGEPYNGRYQASSSPTAMRKKN